MSRPRNIDAALVKRARFAVARATTVQDLRAAQAVLLPAAVGTTLTETAGLLGVGRATAARLQQRFRHMAPAATRTGRGGWGGRRNALLTPEAEQAFLAPWMDQAKTGGMLSWHRCAPLWRNDSAIRSSPRWSIDYWPDTAGGKSRPIRVTPRATPRQEDWEKLPEKLAAILTVEAVRDRRVRLMFQDEARFWRMVRIRHCWAPAPLRPVVNGYERELVYGVRGGILSQMQH